MRAGPPRTSRRAGASSAYPRILAVVHRIPRGCVATYGQIAALAGFAHAPRLAGYALHALPDGSPLPWHRVVGAGGRLSLARLSPEGALQQRMRLEAEGVRFDPRGRVRMSEFQWRPRGGRPATSKRRARSTSRSSR
jgi:methylated-DNA-protein-cysteine methyltransferase-like protein